MDNRIGSTSLSSTSSSDAPQETSNAQEMSSNNLDNYSPLQLVAFALTAAMDVMTDLTQILTHVSQAYSEVMNWLEDVENQLIDLSSQANVDDDNEVYIAINTSVGSLYYKLCILIPANPNASPPTYNNHPAIGTEDDGQWRLTAGDLQQGISVVQGHITNLTNSMSKVSTIMSQTTNFYNKLQETLSNMIKAQSQTLQTMANNV